MQRQITILIGPLIILCLLAPPALPAAAQAPPPAPDMCHTTGLMFVENVGQFARGARFQTRAGDQTIWLADDAIWITVIEALAPGAANTSRRGVHLRLTFPGANPSPRMEPFGRQKTIASYFRGPDAASWRAAVPVWAGVRYADLYPGIDLLVGIGDEAALPWQLAARPGADLSVVRLCIEGVDDVPLLPDLTPAGMETTLNVTTAIGKVTIPLPRVGDGRPAPPHAALRAADNPADLLYSTFLGGGSSSSWMASAPPIPPGMVRSMMTKSKGMPASFILP